MSIRDPVHDTAKDLTHLDEEGRARMVGVGDKPETARGAIALSRVRLSAQAFERVRDASGAKGDAVQVARIAGIQGAKRTSDLIPLCHPLRITRIDVVARLLPEGPAVEFEVRVEAFDRTGVEMEAMTGASVAALTLYDMVKAVDRAAVIEQVRLVEKWGGRSGRFRPHDAP
jgi:cyclic pyranopterin phosphate synthase